MGKEGDKIETDSTEKEDIEKNIIEGEGSKSKQEQRGDRKRTNRKKSSGEDLKAVRKGNEERTGGKGELMEVEIGWQTGTEMRIHLQELYQNIDGKKECEGG